MKSMSDKAAAGIQKTMSDKAAAEIEKKIYNDLTPVRKAGEVLADYLPEDSRTIPDEAWHFFHFETEDYAAAERTIQRAGRICERNYGWGMAQVYSLGSKIREIDGKIKKVNPKKTLSAREIVDELLKLEDLEKNCPVFLYIPPADTNSADRLLMMDVMRNFLVYCAEERSKKTREQIAAHAAVLDEQEVLDYNRIFFFSYGSHCNFPDDLRGALRVISYSPLKKEDFEALLWEHHLRTERQKQKRSLEIKHQNREISELLPQDPMLNSADELFQWYANHMTGLEEITVRRLLALLAAQNADYGNTEAVDKIIIQYKNAILKQHGRLELIEVKSQSPDQVKGLDAIQAWLDEHKSSIVCYDKSPVPSGILLVGIPGTGKSATAKQAAAQLRLPLVKMEMNRILGGRVGDSEKGMQEMLDDLRFVAPCVLWIDEIEKAMSGASGKEEGGGTIRRLFGMLLTFIQENDRPVFMVTTANDISKLPPEFFRSGRFNQTFSLVMPNYEECRDIMQLKLNYYMSEVLGWDKKFLINEAGKILDACLGTPENPRFLTGADIEAHVLELYWYYKSQGITSYSDLREQAEENDSVPIAQMQAQMEIISHSLRAQGSPASKQTMEEIAGHYLYMLLNDMRPAGKPNSCYVKENLLLDRVRFFEYDKNSGSKEIPLCMKVPPEYEEYKIVDEISENNRKSPQKWYDKRFFFEMVPVMSEMIINDKNLTMDYTRKEYWELQKERQKKK